MVTLHHLQNLCSDSAPLITGFHTEILPQVSEHSRLPRDSPNIKFLLQERAFAHLLSLTRATPTLAFRKRRLACVLPVLFTNWPPGRKARRDWREAGPADPRLAGFGRRELTQEAGPGAAKQFTISPRGLKRLKRGRKWVLMRMRPEGLSTTCPLTAAPWKMSPEWGLPADCHCEIREGVRSPQPPGGTPACRVSDPGSTSLIPSRASSNSPAPVTCS